MVTGDLFLLKTDTEWWTGMLNMALDKHAIAYALAWRNAGQKPNNEMEFYIHYKGQYLQQILKKLLCLIKWFLKTRQSKINYTVNNLAHFSMCNKLKSLIFYL